MNSFSPSLVASIESESDLALDFASFLLRYHRDLDYSDFSEENPDIVNRVKRAESYRSWADIEDLANGFETLTTNFDSHKMTAASAFNELYNHIEKFKMQVNQKMAE